MYWADLHFHFLIQQYSQSFRNPKSFIFYNHYRYQYSSNNKDIKNKQVSNDYLT